MVVMGRNDSYAILTHTYEKDHIIIESVRAINTLGVVRITFLYLMRKCSDFAV